MKTHLHVDARVIQSVTNVVQNGIPYRKNNESTFEAMGEEDELRHAKIADIYLCDQELLFKVLWLKRVIYNDHFHSYEVSFTDMYDFVKFSKVYDIRAISLIEKKRYFIIPSSSICYTDVL